MSKMMQTGCIAEDHLNIHRIQCIVDRELDRAVIMDDTQFCGISKQHQLSSLLGHVARSPRSLASTRNSGVGFDIKAG